MLGHIRSVTAPREQVANLVLNVGLAVTKRAIGIDDDPLPAILRPDRYGIRLAARFAFEQPMRLAFLLHNRGVFQIVARKGVLRDLIVVSTPCKRQEWRCITAMS